MRLFIMTFCVLTLMGCVTSNDPTPKQHLMQMEAYNSLSIQQLKQMAEQGDSDAALALGAAYSKGERGVAVNRVEAAKWIIQSAEAGNAIAQHSAGTAYIVGLGVEKDIAKGVELIKASANQGYASAQQTLSLYYSAGIGVEKDDKEAMKWKEKAALNGCKEISNSGITVTRC